MPVRRVLLGFPAKRWMQMRRRWRALGRAHLARRLRSPEGARAVAVGGEPPPLPAVPGWAAPALPLEV